MEAVAEGPKPLKSDYEVAAEAATKEPAAVAPTPTSEPAKPGRSKVWSVIYVVILALGAFVMTKVPHKAAPQPELKEKENTPKPAPKPTLPRPEIHRGNSGVVVEF